MALSGSLNSSDYDGRYIKFTWSASQSIDNNSSTISWELKGAGTGQSAGWYMSGGFKVVIDNSTVYSVSTDSRIKLYDGTSIASGTKTISHNSDGTRSFSVHIEAGIYTYAVNCSGDGTFTLDTIPRASSFKSVSGNTLGSEMTVEVACNSSSFTHQFWYKLGDSKWYDLGKNLGTTIKFTPDIELCSQLPNKTSGTLQLCIRTYNGSSQVGSDVYKDVTVNVPNNVVPTIDSISLSVVNENEIINEWNLCVKGYSKIQVDCNANGVYGSTISNYTISGGYSATVNSLPYTGDILKSSGDISFACVVKDSRGRKSSSASSTVKVYDYSSPTISKFSVERSAEDSTKMIASVAYSFTLVDTQNYAEAKLYYKESTSDSWTAYGVIDNDVQLTLDVEFEEIKSYNFRVIVKDALGNADREETLVSTIKVLMDLRAGGKGLGVGKICESDSFEVGFEANFYDDAHFVKNIFASNLGLEEHTGMDNCLKDTGLIDTEVNSGCRIYILKPFNLAFIRLYIGGFASTIDAKTDGYTTICSVSDDLKPGFSAALTDCAVKDFSVLIKDTGDIQIVPRSGFSTSNVMYISGIYNLSSESPYYINEKENKSVTSG